MLPERVLLLASKRLLLAVPSWSCDLELTGCHLRAHTFTYTFTHTIAHSGTHIGCYCCCDNITCL